MYVCNTEMNIKCLIYVVLKVQDFKVQRVSQERCVENSPTVTPMINSLNSLIISKFESVESKDMALNQNKQTKNQNRCSRYLKYFIDPM